MVFTKNIDHKRIAKNYMLHQKADLLKSTGNEAVCFIIPYNNTVEFNTHETLSAILYADMLAKQYRQNQKKVYILPAILLDYVQMFLDNTANSSQAMKKDIYNHYKLFYKQCKQIGVQFSLPRYSFLETDMLVETVQSIQYLYKKNYVYDTYDVRYRSMQTQTVLSENDIYSQEEIEDTYLIKLFVESKKHVITAYIQDVIYLFGISGIAVHPLDKRYKKMVGKNVIIPIINKPVPVIADDTVDMTTYEGAVALIPAHYKKHMILAEKHGLLVDKFSINQRGMFTGHAEQFAGKNAFTFKENIIRYLQDISNLASILQEKKTIYYSKASDERIYFFASKQVFFGLPQAMPFSDSEIIVLGPDASVFKKELLVPASRCIVKQIDGVPMMPCLFSGVTSQEQGLSFFSLEDIATSSKGNTSCILTCMVMLSILDGVCADRFSLLVWVDSMLQQRGKEYVWQKYMMYLQKDYPDLVSNDYKKILSLREALSLSTDVEKKYTDLVERMEQSFAIQHEDGEWYRFVWSDIGAPQGYTYPSMGIDTTFQASVQTTKLIQTHMPKDTSFIIVYTAHTTHFVKQFFQYHWALFQQSHYTFVQLPIQDTYYLPSQVRKDSTIDTYRLLAHDASIATPIHTIDMYQFFLRKLWNASRYVFFKTDIQQKKPLKDMIALINPEQLDDIDVRLYTKAQKVFDDALYHAKKLDTLSSKQDLISFVWYDVCENYLELAKDDWNEQRQILWMQVFCLCLRLLYPYMPIVSYTLWKQLAVSESIYTKYTTDIFSLTCKKNHKFSLMMDLCMTWKMRYTKHQPRGKKVYLAVQANRDFLSFVQSHESTIHHLCKNASVTYVAEDQDITSHIDILEKELVVNITVGFSIEKELVKTSETIDIAGLESDLEHKQQLLQKVRSILSLLGDHEVAMKEAYTTEMKKLKAEIETIEFDIRRYKYRS